MFAAARPSGGGRSGGNNVVGGGDGDDAVLVEFRAGRMHLSDRTVTADPRKGQVRVVRSVDGLTHFHWIDRGTRDIEEDLIIFPGEATFRGVPECTSGRVYLLEFSTSDKRLFFWMQEPRAERDVASCQRVNNALEGRELDAGGGEADDSDGGSGGGGGGGDDARPQGETRAGGASGVTIRDLQSVLSSLNSGGGDSDGGSASQSQSQSQYHEAGAVDAGASTSEHAAAASESPSINQILDADTLDRILQDEHVRDAVQPLAASELPAGHSEEDIMQVVRSPQFRQQMDVLSRALLQSGGQARELLASFGLEADADAANGMEALIGALVRHARQKREREQQSDEGDAEDEARGGERDASR